MINFERFVPAITSRFAAFTKQQQQQQQWQQLLKPIRQQQRQQQQQQRSIRSKAFLTPLFPPQTSFAACRRPSIVVVSAAFEFAQQQQQQTRQFHAVTSSVKMTNKLASVTHNQQSLIANRSVNSLKAASGPKQEFCTTTSSSSSSSTTSYKQDGKHRRKPLETLLNTNNTLSVWQSSMASVQSLATNVTRESIETIMHQLRNKNAKQNQNQEISLVKDEVEKIAYICFKSAAKNAISAKMMCDFTDVLDELYEWQDGKGVMISGHNGFFCSGGDLISVREMADYEGGSKMAILMQYNMNRLQALPMITMALIEGKALGGGAEIASAVDLRVMASSAYIGYVHVRVGICSAWGGGSRLVQLIGPSRAIELMASGRLVSAKEALSIGLANHVIEETTTETTTQTAAKQYLHQHLLGAKSTIIAIKALVNAARTMPLEQALNIEAQILASTWGKPPHIEALNNNVKHKC